jgi:F-type H+-transporting ATPase subunit b
MTLFAALRAAEPAAGGGLVSLQVNLMFWTLVIFLILFWILKKYAFPAVLGAVEAREKALADAIEGAKRDREEAARVLGEHRQQLDGARAEAQRMIAEARAVAEKSRAELLENTRQDQQEMLERARRDIGVERDKAIAELRREAVDLAIAGASKVVEQNLDSDKNRKLVEAFLSSLSTEKR